MNTQEFKNLAYDVLPSLNKKFKEQGKGNVAVTVRDDLHLAGNIYIGISDDSGKGPYETYLISYTTDMQGRDWVSYEFKGYSN